jgi:hypothetical protein
MNSSLRSWLHVADALPVEAAGEVGAEVFGMGSVYASDY